MKKLTRKQLATLEGLMDKVEEFINQEETLKAMISVRRPQESAPEKKKEAKKAGKEELTPVKRFADYNFTSINARAVEVLTMMKGDPECRWPPKITRTSSPRNKDKYYEYHAATGHTTEEYILAGE
jgi:hypothetical protein